MVKVGFEKVVDWECLYLNRIWKVFLSVYVDDLKAAGPAASLKLMWAELKKHLDIDPPKKMVDNQYLGCSQRDIFPEEVDIERMSAAFAVFSVNRGDAAARVAHPELRKDYVGPKSEADNSRFDIANKTNHVIDAKTVRKSN